ncbi:lactonase family protein [Granulicella sp. WH15]|nr:lactonase family protein [Granulicella sp. WH15]
MISRRSFLVSLPAITLSARTAFGRAGAPMQTRRIFIGTGGRGPGQGIFTADWNAATGEIGVITLAAEVASPTFLATHRRGTESLIYAVTEAGGKDAKISAYTTVAGEARLKLLNISDTQGGGPTHVSVSPDGRCVFVANYGGGSVSSYRVLADGSLSGPVSHFQFSGSGPVQERQEKPHTHSAITSPDGRFVFVNDLGLDRIMIYRLDSNTAEMTPCDPPYFSSRPGSGPRHLAWNPNGRFVYCANELDSTVDVLAWDKKKTSLRLIGSLSSLPENFPKGTAFVGEIASSADGRNVYAGNRVADDTIAVFDVNRKTGLLTQVQLADGGGKNARHIALDPSQRWLVISHQDSNDLTVLERNQVNGRLSSPIHSYPLSKPMCAVFV